MLLTSVPRLHPLARDTCDCCPQQKSSQSVYPSFHVPGIIFTQYYPKALIFLTNSPTALFAPLSSCTDINPVSQEFNNVERLVHTANLPLEAAPTLPTDPQKSWPEHGVIKFTNVKMRYREQMPLVLKGLTLDVAAGEKIGIVGRTGAGKSSLTQVLFRIVELAEGKIEIDGVDLSKVGLDTLRTR